MNAVQGGGRTAAYSASVGVMCAVSIGVIGPETENVSISSPGGKETQYLKRSFKSPGERRARMGSPSRIAFH